MFRNTPFKYVPVTTQNCCVELEYPIDYSRAFYFLPTEYIPNMPVFKDVKELPFLNKPGAIMSMRDTAGNSRGVCKVKKVNNEWVPVKSFGSACVTIDMCISCKNVSIKLFASKIGLSGVKNSQQAMETAVLLINKIIDIQRWFDWVDKYPDYAQQVIDWYKQNSKANPTLIPIPTEQELKMIWLDQHNINYTNDNVIKQYQENYDNFKQQYLNNIAEQNKQLLDTIKLPTEIHVHQYWAEKCEILTDFALYIHNISQDYNKHSLLCEILDMFVNSRHVTSLQNNPKLLVNNNVNHNFDLGCKIIRSRLAKKFSAISEYEVIYRNDSSSGSGVIITIPYDRPPFEIPEEIKPYINRGKSNKYQFVVFSSGSVTFSGPHVLLNEIAYNKFMQDFATVAKDVCDSTTFRIKIYLNGYKQQLHQRLEQQYNINRSDVHGSTMLEKYKLYSLYPPEPLASPEDDGSKTSDDESNSNSSNISPIPQVETIIELPEQINI